RDRREESALATANLILMQKYARGAAALVAAAVVLAPVPALAKPRSAPKLPCAGDPTATRRIDVGSTYGFYALPAKKPAGIVVYDHGYGHNAEDWQEHLSQTAQRDGVIAIAMNYVADEARLGEAGGSPRVPTPAS